MTAGPRLIEPRDVAAIARTIEAGGVVLLPTDTVYGLCCDPTNMSAVNTIFDIKGRTAEVPLATLVSGSSAAIQIVDETRCAFDLELIDSPEWPGELTLVLPMKPRSGFADGVGTEGDAPTVGLRRPAPSLIADLLDRCGVLAATSANAHGEPTHSAPSLILDGLARRAAGIAAYVDGGPLDSPASAVVSVDELGWTMLRDGRLGASDVSQLLRLDRSDS